MSRGCHNAWHAHGRDTYLEAISWPWEAMRAEADRTFAAISGSGMAGASGMYAPA
jgi:hypothetical protein